MAERLIYNSSVSKGAFEKIGQQQNPDEVLRQISDAMFAIEELEERRAWDVPAEQQISSGGSQPSEPRKIEGVGYVYTTPPKELLVTLTTKEDLLHKIKLWKRNLVAGLKRSEKKIAK